MYSEVTPYSSAFVKNKKKKKKKNDNYLYILSNYLIKKLNHIQMVNFCELGQLI